MPESGRSRRDFLAASAIALTAAVPAAQAQGSQTASDASSNSRSMATEPFAANQGRVGLIGTGGRGTSLLKNMLAADLTIQALCDVVPEKAKAAQALVTAAGQKAPELYTSGDEAFRKLVSRDDIDIAIVATPWHWHTPMAVAAMEAGKHVCTEVPAATTLEDCWKLVDTSERTRRHCMMLENCCYGENELMVLGMVGQGLFGDLLYGEAAYLHDLREEMFSNKGEGLWRRKVHTERDGNLYPTHGLGPVANYMGVNRGDRFVRIVSMSTPAKGLAAYREAHIPKDDPKWKEKYVDGDLCTSLIQTASGLTINLQHDVSNPHPYDRLNAIAGTKGIFRDYPPRIYLEGQAGGEEYGPIDSYKQKFEHPLWQRQGELARKLGGHGGMDFLMIYRLQQCLRQGLPPDMNVYDAATWSAPGPLSATSIAGGSSAVEYPDFTRGRWKTSREKLFAT